MHETVDEVGTCRGRRVDRLPLREGREDRSRPIVATGRSHPRRSRRVRRVRIRRRRLPLARRRRGARTCAATDVRGALFTPHCAVDPSGAPDPRHRGRRGRGAGSGSSNAPPSSESIPAGSRPTAASCAADVVVRADRGVHHPVHRPSPRPDPDLLADDRHRTARRRAVGDRSGSPIARRSPTAGTSSSTANARPTVAWRSEDVARRTTGGRPSPRRTTPTGASAICSSPAWSTCSPRSPGHRITHHWGGPIGVPRDWHCSVTFDPATGLAAAGGYVGDGVATTNLAGRTLADLITGSELRRSSRFRGSAIARRDGSRSRCDGQASTSAAGRPPWRTGRRPAPTARVGSGARCSRRCCVVDRVQPG